MREENFSRLVKIVGHLFFLALFILAGYYFKERTIILDSALQILKWIEFDGFNIEAGRWSAIIPQIIPKLLIWTGAPLKVVLMSTSLSFILVFYLAFLLAIYKFRSPWAASGILLALVLCSLRTFYFSVVEVHQALVYPFLLLAWLQYHRKMKGWRFLVPAMLLMALCFLTHPTTLFTVVFVVGFVALTKKELNRPWPWVLAGFAVLFFILRWTVFSVSTYESGLYADAMELGVQGFWQLPGNRFVLDQVWKLNTLYLLPTLLLLLTLFLMLRQRRYWLAVYQVLAVMLFLLVNAFAFQRGDSAMMMEKNYLALGVFIAIGLVGVLKDSPKGRLVLAVLLPLVLMFKFRDLAMNGAKTAKPRIEALASLVESAQQQHGQLFVVPNENVPERISVHWALACEALLFSALDNGKQVVLVSSEQAQNREAVLGRKNVLVMPYLYENGKVEDLDSRYFRIAPGQYRVLKTKSDQ